MIHPFWPLLYSARKLDVPSGPMNMDVNYFVVALLLIFIFAIGYSTGKYNEKRRHRRNVRMKAARAAFDKDDY